MVLFVFKHDVSTAKTFLLLKMYANNHDSVATALLLSCTCATKKVHKYCDKDGIHRVMQFSVFICKQESADEKPVVVT